MTRLAAFILVISATAGPASAQSGDRAAIDRAIASVYPSLVRISVVVADHREGREVNLEGSGSGTIISADGYVVTNHHVAGRARRIICTLADRQEIPADLIGTDPLTDITVLKLRPAAPRTFPVARFGDSSRLRRGDTVLAMGSPLALSQSVTVGVASNTEMTMPGGRGGLDLDGEDVGSIVRWFGHDAAIYPGNSGGPLVNLAGEIIGVNEISLGLSGAIPGNLAKQVADAIIRDGRVRRSWTGFEVQPRVAATAGPGALISWVASGSPAAAAGFRAGDMLLRVNDTAIDVQFAEQLPLTNQVLVGLKTTEPSSFVVRREGKDMTLRLTPIDRPAAISIPRELRDWGFVASNLTPFEARGLGRSSSEGIRVVSVRPGGPAEQSRPALQRDDIILEIDGRRVASLSELESRPSPATKTGMLVGFERGRERRLTVVEIGGGRPADSPPAEARKAWIPIAVQVLTPPLAERLGLKGSTGVRVTEVLDAAVPLQVGDIILSIDGQPVRASAPADEEVFFAAVRRAALGATAELGVNRNGTAMTIPVKLGIAPALAREMKRHEDEDFGFRARDLADADRRDPRFERAPSGVLVEGVTQGSWASLGRLAGGDVIEAIDGRPVANVDDLAARMKAIKTARPSSVVLLVRRGVRTLFLDLEPAW